MSKPVQVKCRVVKNTSKAWLIEAKHIRSEVIQVWIPVSQIIKTETTPRLASDPHHRITERNFNRTIFIPDWLASENEILIDENISHFCENNI